MSTIGNWIDTLRAKLSHLAPEIDPILTVLEVALSVTGIGGPGAVNALKVIQAALDTLAQASLGTLTHDQLVQQLADLKAEASAQIVAIESAQDATLAAKFPDPPVEA